MNDIGFLQSWQWGEFQESLGRKTWQIEQGGSKILVIKHNLPLGKSFLYCPRGPIIKSLKEVKEISQKEKSIFFKIEPEKDWGFAKFGFRKSFRQIQPKKTLILDLNKSEPELLSAMRQKTRYNIKLAQRKNITIQVNNQKLSIFLDLLKQTSQRDKFHLHPINYYQKMMEILGRDGLIKLFLAEYQGKVIVANLMIFFNETATYLHGASDYAHHQLMAPYLLQWQAILAAKQMGLKYYDFWGLDEQKWPGVSRFKRGFGGREIVYPGSFDLIFQPTWYKVYNLARRIL